MGSLWFKMSVDHSRPGSKLPYKSFATLAFVITGGRYKSLSWWSNASTIISYIFLDYTIQNASRRFAGSVSDTWFPSGMKVFKRNISQSIPTHGSFSSERLTNWQQGNKTSNHRVRCTMSIDVDRCRMMSYAPWRLAVPSKLSFWAPTAPGNSRNATRRMLFLSLLLLLSRRCKAMRTPLSPRSLPTQCRKKGFNATHSLCSTTVFTLGHPVCFKLPLFQWFAHFANLRIPLFERVSAGLRLPCASGCRRLRAEDLQKSANCLG